jgi:hypothetical protein
MGVRLANLPRAARIVTPIAACVIDCIGVDKDHRSATRNFVTRITPGCKLVARFHHCVVVVRSIVAAGDAKILGERSPWRKSRCVASFDGVGWDRLVDLIAVGVQAEEVSPIWQVFGGEFSCLGQSDDSRKEQGGCEMHLEDGRQRAVGGWMRKIFLLKFEQIKVSENCSV